MSEEFNYINRDDMFKILEPNEPLKITKNTLGGLTYYSIDNFLKNPSETTSVLKNWPVFRGHMYVPGDRQNFNPMDLVPILKTYTKLLPALGLPETDVTISRSQGLLMSEGMQVWKNSWMPHYDKDRVVCNIGLCDYDGGTSFYKYKGHYNNDNSVLPKNYQNTKKDIIVPWQNFDGDEDWELYHIIPTKFNTLVIYEGKMFHGSHAKFSNEHRYVLQSFLLI